MLPPLMVSKKSDRAEQNRIVLVMDPKLYEAATNGDFVYLQNTPNINSQLTPNHSTVLHVAAQFNQTQFVRIAMSVCPSLLWLTNSHGDTALHIAAREGGVDIVEILIEYVKNNDVEIGQRLEFLRTVNLDEDTALHCAARTGYYRSVELIVQTDPDLCRFVNIANESPLYLSVASGNWDVPQLITQAFPNSTSIPFKGANGLTALHPAVYTLDYPLNTIESLVTWRREMIREGDELGLTPLHYAALYGMSAVIKLFLQYDTSAIYVLDGVKGQSALHLAAFRGHIEAVKELIKGRPDCCEVVDKKGRTALHVAVLGDKRKMVKFMIETPNLSWLINKPDKDGNTPLHLAALFKLYTVVEILAKSSKVNLYVENKEFLTPFDVYAKYKEYGLRAEVTRYVLKNSKGMMTMQRFANSTLKQMSIEAVMIMKDDKPNNSSETKTKTEASSSNLGQQSALEINLLVSTLVATVTFAAGFTVPGGYINNGEDEGMATLRTKTAFQVFVVFNTMAFCCSVYAVLLQFHTSLTDYHQRIRYMGIAAFSTTIAIVAMVLAFTSGTYVVLTKSIALSVTPYVICGFFTFLYFAVLVADPGSNGFPCVIRLQKFIRGKVIRYIRFEE